MSLSYIRKQGISLKLPWRKLYDSLCKNNILERRDGTIPILGEWWAAFCDFGWLDALCAARAHGNHTVSKGEGSG